MVYIGLRSHKDWTGIQATQSFSEMHNTLHLKTFDFNTTNTQYTILGNSESRYWWNRRNEHCESGAVQCLLNTKKVSKIQNALQTL